MNTKISRTEEPHRFRLALADKFNLKNPNKNLALANLSIYYTWKNIQPAYNNNKFKISAPTWNDEFDLPDGSYSISDFQDYFEYIIKKSHSCEEGGAHLRFFFLAFIDELEKQITIKKTVAFFLENIKKNTCRYHSQNLDKFYSS